MNRKIQITCPNCGKVNIVMEGELVSGMPIKDMNGNIVEEFPPVVVDDNTLVACEGCGYPMSGKDAKVLK